VKFGRVELDQVKGAILAHAMDTSDGRLKKGKLIDDADINLLRLAGIASLIVARLEPGDVEENEAARTIADALVSAHISAAEAFTGRVNLFTKKAGILSINTDLVNAINRIDPGITLATIPQNSTVEAGRMVATVKIIPFAVTHENLATVTSLIGQSAVLDIAPYRARNVGLVATQLPSLKPATMDKTKRVLEARLAVSKSAVIEELRVAHEVDAVAAALSALRDKCDLIILFGASAITDIEDVIPEALCKAGGVVDHFGMPVDPGNLLLQGHLDDVPVIGAPGCARSPAENGFDWVLQRLLADMPFDALEIEGLGVGGLLMEIHSRPQPREAMGDMAGKVHAIILAAGQSRRMGKSNKLLASFDGKTMVHQVAEIASASRVAGITVVTGHEDEDVQDALSGIDVAFTHNPDFASGLASSLRCGIAALPADCSGAIILLADMPRITTAMIDRQIAAFTEASQNSIIQATSHGKRGNPVLWPSCYFDALKQISGDVGARHIIGQNAERVIEIELGEAAALDIDTPEALRAEGGEIAGE